VLPLVARYFDLHMLALAGYQPQLFRCIECHELFEPVTNYFSVAEGGVLCPRHGEGRIGAEPLPLPLFKTLRFLQTREWNVVARLDLSEGLQIELERLLQSMLVYHLERNLRSTAFLRTVRDDLVTG
jgi:DNA repair protein RecO (recombination protein O)